MNKRQKLFAVLLFILFISLMSLLVYLSTKATATDKTLRQLQESILEIQQQKPQVIKDNTPIRQEIIDLIEPLIPSPVPGKNGKDGIDGKDGINGTNGVNGNDGADALPCTTFTDEDNDAYISCPDGTKTLIPKPEQPRQIELCSSLNVPFGWRYVGTITCMKVKES